MIKFLVKTRHLVKSLGPGKMTLVVKCSLSKLNNQSLILQSKLDP